MFIGEGTSRCRLGRAGVDSGLREGKSKTCWHKSRDDEEASIFIGDASSCWQLLWGLSGVEEGLAGGRSKS